MSRPTLDTAEPFPFSRTGLSPSMDGLSSAILLTSMVSYAVRTPDCTQPGLGSFAFARRYSQNRCFFLFLRLLRCFSSPGSPRYTIYSCNGDGPLRPPGFPIRTSTDQCSFAAPRGFSQLVTSFIGSQCQGIRPAPLFA